MLNILVPTDYSPQAKNALRYAYEFARYTGSKLILYHAIPEMIPASDIPFENYYLDEVEEKELLMESFYNMAEVEKWNKDEVPVDVCVNLTTNIGQGINNAVKKMEADMVIMGTHGASGWKKYVLGSNTAHLISIASYPILAIPTDYRFQAIYHIVYASDLSRLSQELGIMIPFSKMFHAVLEIFYFDYASPESEEVMLRAEKEISQMDYKNLRLSIKKGNLEWSVDEQLAKQVNLENTQILALFRGSHTWLDDLLLGSNSQKMVLSCGLPVLVMRKDSLQEE